MFLSALIICLISRERGGGSEIHNLFVCIERMNMSENTTNTNPQNTNREKQLQCSIEWMACCDVFAVLLTLTFFLAFLFVSF